jgi:hypothetical protein
MFNGSGTMTAQFRSQMQMNGSIYMLYFLI